MEKVKDFFKWFNRPAQILEIFGYIFVVMGIIVAVIGVIQCFTSNSSGASVGTNHLAHILLGAIIAIVAPQPFFAIAKVVKAAEKYLGEK